MRTKNTTKTTAHQHNIAEHSIWHSSTKDTIIKNGTDHDHKGCAPPRTESNETSQQHKKEMPRRKSTAQEQEEEEEENNNKEKRVGRGKLVGGGGAPTP